MKPHVLVRCLEDEGDDVESLFQDSIAEFADLYTEKTGKQKIKGKTPNGKIKSFKVKQVRLQLDKLSYLPKSEYPSLHIFYVNL